MEQYIVSARKYRPDNFGSLIGQDNIARTLKNSILRGQLAHAYLFCGPRGVGKTSSARIFAKTINCMNPSPDMEPCGKCESCISFDEGRSYCIHELDAASNNGVEDIKQLMDKVRIPPQVGKYSVYIIDEVHMLSQSAFNAFLKTLEEPPAHAIFILATTEKHKILPTILSRCQTYDFNRISVDNIVLNLKNIASKEGISIGDEALHVIAMKADGAMRDALTLFDQTVAFCGKDVAYEDVIANLNVLDYEYYFRLVDYLTASDRSSALLLFDEILSKGFNALHFISGLASHIRDLIVSKSGAMDSLLELPASLKQRYRDKSAGIPYPVLYSALEATVQCESSYRTSVSQRLLIEFTLMKLAGIFSSQTDRQMPADAGNVQPSAKAVEPQPSPVVPAVQAAPVAEPVRKVADEVPSDRPVHKRKNSLSISSIMENGVPDESKEMKTSVAASGNAVSTPVTEDSVKAVWATISDRYKSRPRLYSAISSARLELVVAEGGKYILEFYVANEAQKGWIQDKLHKELEERLRAAMNTRAISLNIEVDAEAENKSAVHYMPTEKAKFLMSNSEEVRNLCDDLGLDIK